MNFRALFLYGLLPAFGLLLVWHVARSDRCRAAAGDEAAHLAPPFWREYLRAWGIVLMAVLLLILHIAFSGDIP
ncbi:hypothetical protein [Streptomyces sp. NBC_00154]|uniref:hypothetical protein n=1 Tax=Streptomyces sp. NBC_00154 TaxID=2975670 RepID=UPI002258FF56|nr:hypothetical protein [Streptomyces sp. NBC_00154]MCX5317212.1 hypothetical protein [Streptomyces sp. NBC_00154]